MSTNRESEPTVRFPPYTYVPGETPHPFSDPQGHRFAGTQLPEQPLNLHGPEPNAAYDFGLELFERGYYWEAHEVWEGLWKQVGRSGEQADFLKGLIKLAAALVKARERRAVGVRRHAKRAAELFDNVWTSLGRPVPDDGLGGLSLRRLQAEALRVAEQAERLVIAATGGTLDPPAPLPQVVLPRTTDR